MVTFFFILLLCVGVLMLILLTLEIIKIRKLLTNGIKTDATIVRYEIVHGDESDGEMPILEYFHQGIRRQLPYGTTVNTKKFPIGKVMSIIYDPEKKKNPKVYSFWGLYRNIFLFTLIFLLSSCLVLKPLLNLF